MNLAQIKTFTEMDSHDEKVYQAVRQVCYHVTGMSSRDIGMLPVNSVNFSRSGVNLVCRPGKLSFQD